MTTEKCEKALSIDCIEWKKFMGAWEQISLLASIVKVLKHYYFFKFLFIFY